MHKQRSRRTIFANLFVVHFLQQVAWFVILAVSLLLAAPVSAATLSGERQGELRTLLYQDCGSCHGMRLTGGLGPALTAPELKGKPRAFLVATIREGRAGTPMPPWGKLLSEADIDWLVDYLLDSKDHE